jgi:hypothetical protein
MKPILLIGLGVLVGTSALANELAGVQPSFRELNGQEPVAFILSQNIHRRHLNKG